MEALKHTSSAVYRNELAYLKLLRGYKWLINREPTHGCKLVTAKLFFTTQIIQLTRSLDCTHIIQWLMSGCAWLSIHYSFNNYQDALPCKRGIDIIVRRAVDLPSLRIGGVGGTDTLHSFSRGAWGRLSFSTITARLAT